MSVSRRAGRPATLPIRRSSPWRHSTSLSSSSLGRRSGGSPAGTPSPPGLCTSTTSAPRVSSACLTRSSSASSSSANDQLAVLMRHLSRGSVKFACHVYHTPGPFHIVAPSSPGGRQVARMKQRQRGLRRCSLTPPRTWSYGVASPAEKSTGMERTANARPCGPRHDVRVQTSIRTSIPLLPEYQADGLAAGLALPKSSSGRCPRSRSTLAADEGSAAEVADDRAIATAPPSRL